MGHDTQVRLQNPTGVKVKDPVCGMEVDPPSAAGHVEHQGKTYYFCSRNCLSKFEADPTKYVDTPKETPKEEASGEYTCPMHPEIVRDAPGNRVSTVA